MSETPFFLSAKFWRAVLLLSFIAGFLWGFWDEVNIVGQLIMTVVLRLFQQPVSLTINYEILLALSVVGLNIVVFCVVYVFVLLWISQFTLPVRNPSDRWKIFKRSLRYSIPFAGSRGPAIIVKEGKPFAGEEELNDTQPGIALVDLYSSIVLEQQGYKSDMDTSETGSNRIHDKRPNLPKIPHLLGLDKTVGEKPVVRACGPGIVFTDHGEKIIGFADLRKQFRKHADVSSNTGDGIEVTTDISVTFTIGQPPEILKVTKRDDNWVVVKVENLTIQDTHKVDRIHPDRIIKGFSDELENEDKEEIDAYFRRGSFVWKVGVSENIKTDDEDSLPFAFDEDRVIDAVYSRARHAKEGRLSEWTELPVDVAVELFRNKLAHESYDELYLPEDPEKYPMKSFRADFGKSVRNMGVLGYQIVRRKDGQLLENGQVCRNNELVFSPSQDFRRSTVLRDRGIKILSAGFSNLIPTHDIIRTRFFDNWRAHWQEEADKTTADHELQAMRIRNRERAKVQQEMIYSFSQILQTEQHTSEAIAMRLYQALEMAATQPATQRLLPSDTIQMLQSLREWLLPAEQIKETHVDNEYIDGQERFLEEDSAS